MKERLALWLGLAAAAGVAGRLIGWFLRRMPPAAASPRRAAADPSRDERRSGIERRSGSDRRIGSLGDTVPSRIRAAADRRLEGERRSGADRRRVA